MTPLVLVPFGASAVLAVVSRWVSRRAQPRLALWSIAISAPVAAIATIGVLAVLASPVPAQIPVVAALGRWRPGEVARHTTVPPAVSLLALMALVLVTWRVVERLRTQASEVHAAWKVARATPDRGGLVVIDDPEPSAHAVGLPGASRVLVSTGMLALLDDEERAAVMAHERAHLRGGHSILVVLTELAAALDPLLRTLPDDVAFTAERCADETAATATSREVTAAALAKVALAKVTARRSFALGANGHSVTVRVQALLAPPEARARAAWLPVAVAAAALGAVALALHDTERFFEAVRIWSQR